MNVKHDVSLSGYTTFKIGGRARFFVEVTTDRELQEALRYAREHSLPIFILGGGSNILVSDEGFGGLVIHIATKSIKFEDLSGNNVENGGEKNKDVARVIAEAGENWDELVAKTIEQGFGGLENLSGIPGTVGAAPVQNIGAYGSEIKDSLEWVEAVNRENEELTRFKNVDCQFAYRDSFFKKPEGKKFIIVRVALKLRKNVSLNISYKDFNGLDLKSASDVRVAVLDIRKRKLPNLALLGTAGSFFKNPIITRARYAELKTQFPEMPFFDVDAERVKIPLAWILDHVCDWKGTRRGDVGVYQNQALVLVNFGGASAADIKNLAKEMAESVKQRTGIEISPEVEFI